MIATEEPKLPKLPSDKAIWGAILIFFVVIFLLVSKCGSPDPIVVYSDPNIKLKEQLFILTKQNVELKKLAYSKEQKSKDKVIEYRYIKKFVPVFRALPCDSAQALVPIIIQACDSVITADSITILAYKGVIKSDSIIINGYKEIVANDSIAIKQLNKKTKKYRRQRNFVAGVGLLGWIFAVVK